MYFYSVVQKLLFIYLFIYYSSNILCHLKLSPYQLALNEYTKNVFFKKTL